MKYNEDIWLGKSGEGKECMFVKLSYENYIQLCKYCKENGYYYCVSSQIGNDVVVSLEKKIWKKFNNLFHKLI